MKRTIEIALCLLMALGILAGISTTQSPVMADGSDPMPLCRHGKDLHGKPCAAGVPEAH